MIDNFDLKDKIRLAKPSDYEELKKLMNADTQYHCSLDSNYKKMVKDNQEYFDNELEETVKIKPNEGGNLVCILYNDNFSRVAGILSYKYESESIVYISDLYIQPTYRGRGFGRQLLNYLIKKNPNKEFQLLCLVKNSLAYKFYKDFGFKVINQSKGKRYHIANYTMSYKKET